MMLKKKHFNDHQLFYFATCPYCIKVRLALRWMGIKLPLKDILFSSANKAELVAGGGKEQVPCLRIEHEKGDVQWMYESGEIIQYLKQQL